MRPLRDLVRHTLVYGLGNVSASLVGFALIPLYTRRLSPEEFGVLGLFLLLHTVLNPIYDLGLTTSVGRFFFEYRSDPSGRKLGDMVATTTAFLLAWSGTLSLLLVVLAPLVASLVAGSPGHAPLVRIVALTLFLEALAVPPLTLLRMEERSVLWAAVTTARVLATVGLNLYLVLVRGWGVEGILLSAAFCAGMVLVLTLPLLVRRMGGGGLSRPVLAEMLRFGLPFLPVLVGLWVIDFSDRWLLERLRNKEEVGLYTLAYKFGQSMMVAVAAFRMGWAPIRYRLLERPDAPAVYARIGTAVALALAGLALALALVADELIRVAATPAYFAAAPVVPLIGLAYALHGFHFVTSTGMGVARRAGGLAIVFLAAALINVVLNLALIPRFGMTAAAATTVVAHALVVGGSLALSQRLYRIDYEWGRIARITAAAIAVAALDRWLQPEGVLAGCALAVVLFAVFIALVALGGGIGPADAAALRTYLRETLTGDERDEQDA